MTETVNGLELRSRVSADGTLTLSLEDVAIEAPAADEVIVQVEATPISPSDLFLLVGLADTSTAIAGGTSQRPILTMRIPPERMAPMSARLEQSLPVGNQGAGTVVRAGADAAHLLGRRVAAASGAMYTQHRKLKAGDCVVLPDGVAAADGAAIFVNPMTALGFVETARAGGHRGIIHTAAASDLGQMLQKVCLADDIPLVNVVRSREQAEILTGIGARYVLDSNSPTFAADLVDAAAQTRATVAFDAVGGGGLGSDILAAMEAAAVRTMGEFSHYGSTTFKQLYIYGAFDLGPTVLNRVAFGSRWSVSGWLLTPFLATAGADVVNRMRQRVANELTTTFASRYTATISLAQALDPETLLAYNRKATGQRYLIDPSRN